MAFIPLRQKITYERKGDPGRDGRPTYAPPIEMKANVNETSKLVRNSHGAEVMSAAQITLDKEADVRVGDRITYTSRLGRTNTWTIVKVEPMNLLGSIPQTEVFCT